MTLLAETLAAHGTLSRWEAVERIRVRLRCGGLAMAAKGRPGVLRELDATLDTRRPRVDFAQLGVFDGDAGRPDRISRRLRWTDEDVVHFAGYALWNYMTTPFLLARPEVSVEELPDRRLRATFPPDFPTHSRQQVFGLNADGLVAGVDYTAEVFGRWARASNRCLAHETVAGLVFATRRRVTPRGLPGPTLVSIEIDEIEID